MEVNRTFWDGTTREIYVEGTVGETPIITTCPNLETSVRANLSKYQGVEWDKSICPWKINSNSDFFKFQWANPYYKTGVSGTTMAQSPLFKERKKGYTFYISAAGGSSSYMPHERVDSNACTKPLWKTCLSNDELDLTNTDINYWFNLKYRHIFPVINFDYSRIFVAPMIHTESGSGWVFHDDAQIRADWDSTAVYGISLMFYGKSSLGSAYPICAGLFSLNNKFAQPAWDTTNCWKDETMFDNALAVAWSNAWDGSQEVGGIQTVGSNTLWGTDANNPGFADQTFANENAAGAVMYFPMKNIMIQTPADTEDTIWSTEWDHFYLGGGYNQGTKRHLKAGITYDEFANYLKKQLAYLGFRFCIDANHFNDSIDSQYFFIPEIDEKGVTTGTYYAANSAEAANLPNNNWTNDVYTETPYDGTDDEEDEDPNDYDDENKTELNPAAAGYSNEFQNSYVLPFDNNGFSDTATVGEVAAYLYYTAPTNQSETDYLSSNPIDAVVSLMMFPFAIDTEIPSYGLPYVRYGKVVSDKKALGFIKSQIQIIDFGSHLYYPIYGVKDFRSYEPYCDAELVLPYCGNVKILPSLYLNHFIGVKYIIDLVTGACCACIFRDNLMTSVVNGQIGMSLPVTGVRAADLQSDIYLKQTGIKQAANSGLSAIANTVFGTVSAGASGNVIGAAHALIGGILNIDAANTSYKAAEYELSHTQIPFTVRSAASPLTDFANEQYPRLIIKRPIMLDSYNPEIYGHTIGFACLKNDTLNNYHGYTELTGLDFSGFGGTETEKARLKAELENGVYLP